MLCLHTHKFAAEQVSPGTTPAAEGRESSSTATPDFFSVARRAAVHDIVQERLRKAIRDVSVGVVSESAIQGGE